MCCLFVGECVWASGCDWDDVVDDEAHGVWPVEGVVDWFSADGAGWMAGANGGAVFVANCCSASHCSPPVYMGNAQSKLCVLGITVSTFSLPDVVVLSMLGGGRLLSFLFRVVAGCFCL